MEKITDRPLKLVRVSEDEKEFIRNNYGKMSYKEIADEIGCSLATISYQRKIMNIPYSRHRWTDEERRYLVRNYNGHNVKELAAKFNCSKYNIYTMLKFLKDKEFK